MNSCDFSLSNYSYTPVEDIHLEHFSIDEDREDLIPMIKRVNFSHFGGQVKLFASPWFAALDEKTMAR